MKKFTILLLGLIFVIPVFLRAQESDNERKNRIHGGIYLKFGAVFPLGKFAEGQTANVIPTTNSNTSPLIYLPAKTGIAADLGWMFYIGPAFANKHLRVGIDATFLSFWLNFTSPVLSNSKSNQHYYYFGGQKFGPVFTINIVDRLNLDISYKINANFSYYYGEWENYVEAQFSKYGVNFLQQEVSMNIRYSLLMLSFQYNFGDMKYNNMSSSRPSQTIECNTFRILFGLKF